jgi:hypothetical protein
MVFDRYPGGTEFIIRAGIILFFGCTTAHGARAEHDVNTCSCQL